MKKPFILVTLVITSLIISAQSTNILSEYCPPVPWMNAEINEDKKMDINWEKPCDTCEVIKYRLMLLEFNPCDGYSPGDSNFNAILMPLASTLLTSYTYNIYDNYWVGAFAVRADYDTCYSDITYSNTVYYNTWFYDTTFTLALNITTENNADPTGSIVKLDGNDCYYNDYIFTTECSDDSTAYFEDIITGVYDIIISKEGYYTAKIYDYDLWQDTTLYVMLRAENLGINDHSGAEELLIYPNPCKSVARISYNLNQASETCLSVFNSRGELIERKTEYQLKGEQEIYWNAESYSKGLYFLHIDNGNDHYHSKLLLK